jgi:hypothetical protein
MNLMRRVQKFYILPKLHIGRFILFSLISVGSLVSIISITGCTDKAAEIRDQECANIKALIDTKVRAPNTDGYEGAVKVKDEVYKLYDDYHIKCDKKK